MLPPSYDMFDFHISTAHYITNSIDAMHSKGNKKKRQEKGLYSYKKRKRNTAKI